MTQERYNAKPTDICANCLHYANWRDAVMVYWGLCQNKSSDHYEHVLHCKHPVCDLVAWRGQR